MEMEINQIFLETEESKSGTDDLPNENKKP